MASRTQPAILVELLRHAFAVDHLESERGEERGCSREETDVATACTPEQCSHDGATQPATHVILSHRDGSNFGEVWPVDVQRAAPDHFAGLLGHNEITDIATDFRHRSRPHPRAARYEWTPTAPRRAASRSRAAPIAVVTRAGAVPPGTSCRPSTADVSMWARSSAAASATPQLRQSSSLNCPSSQSLLSASRTAAPTISWARRKGTPSREMRAAMARASMPPLRAASDMRAALISSVLTT